MRDKIDIRQSLHKVIGCLRSNEIIPAYELLVKMSAQEDGKYYDSNALCRGHGGDGVPEGCRVCEEEKDTK